MANNFNILDTPASGGEAQLAPDLTRPSDLAGGDFFQRIGGIDTTSGLTEVLGLSGKFRVDSLTLSSLASETMTVKLTIDGVVINNDTFSNGDPTLELYGRAGGSGPLIPFEVKDSLSLEVQMLADTSIAIDFSVEPIL